MASGGPSGKARKTLRRFISNASTFGVKRKGVLVETLRRFESNRINSEVRKRELFTVYIRRALRIGYLKCLLSIRPYSR